MDVNVPPRYILPSGPAVTASIKAVPGRAAEREKVWSIEPSRTMGPDSGVGVGTNGVGVGVGVGVAVGVAVAVGVGVGVGEQSGTLVSTPLINVAV